MMILWHYDDFVDDFDHNSTGSIVCTCREHLRLGKHGRRDWVQGSCETVPFSHSCLCISLWLWMIDNQTLTQKPGGDYKIFSPEKGVRHPHLTCVCHCQVANLVWNRSTYSALICCICANMTICPKFTMSVMIGVSHLWTLASIQQKSEKRSIYNKPNYLLARPDY